MKKIIMLLILIITFSAITLNADVIQREVKQSGNWTSSTLKNYDGFSNVGTTNYCSTRDYTFKINNKSNGSIEYSASHHIEEGKPDQSGLIPTHVNDYVQGQVNTNCSNHAPWFNA